MCYLISVTKNVDQLEIRFDARFRDREKFKPVYSASAFTFPYMPIISNEEPDTIDYYQWGLIPFWVKDEISAKQIRSRTLNARSETIFQKPAFRHAIRTHRCLVLVDGFYEWRHANHRKYPYYIRLSDGDAFALAGLWDSWLDMKTGEYIKTFSIITTVANPLLEKIHNTRKRMPVIIKRLDEKKWLNKEMTEDEIESLMSPYDDSEMEAHTVSKILTKMGFNTVEPLVLERFQYSELPDIA